MTRQSYDTDLTDDQWQILQPLIPAPKSGGRPRIIDVRDILNVNGTWEVMNATL